MFILEVLLGLKSKQGDVTCAFLHADLAPDETVYDDMPLGFNTKSKNGKRQSLEVEQDSFWALLESQGVLEVYHQKA
jgi:hypothetical protein